MKYCIASTTPEYAPHLRKKLNRRRPHKRAAFDKKSVIARHHPRKRATGPAHVAPEE